MYYKLSNEERQERREKYRKNSIYRVVYTPLWNRRGDDLSPEEIWEEANNLAYKLKYTDRADHKMLVEEAFADLCDLYSCFSSDGVVAAKRTFAQSEHSAMMVSLVAFLLLANVYPEAKGHPYLEVCQSIFDVAGKVKDYSELWEDVRKMEGEYESRGEFIEVADFIEQLDRRDSPLSEAELPLAHKVLNQFVDDNKHSHLSTMKENERSLSRINDNNNHIFQNQVDRLRIIIEEVEDGDGTKLEFENIIFAPEYADIIVDIRNAMKPFVIDGVEHIETSRKNQWLAIIEPLKMIDGLLVKHNDRPRRKDCTDGEICQQLEIFFGDELKQLDFENIPKSISAERSIWRDIGVGLSFQDWNKYQQSRTSEKKYAALARIASRVYGEVKRVIKR